MRATRNRLLALLILAPALGFWTSRTRAQTFTAGPGFRGYLGPNVYAPDFYTAYGYAMPRYSYRGPGFDLGTPSGSPGYNGGYPYDYRGYNGNFDNGYPAYYDNYGYGWTPSTPLGYVRPVRPRAVAPRRPVSPPRLLRIGR